MSVQTVRVTVTPEKAMEFLKKNVGNRTLSTAFVLHLSEQMKNGEWKFTGDPIKFSKNDELIDGQHRLSSVVMSNTTQEFMITTGLDDDVFDVLDSGKIRTAGDVLSTIGVDNPRKVATVAKFAILYKRGKYTYFNGGSNTRASKGALVTNQQVRQFVEENPDIAKTVNKSIKLNSKFKNISFTVFGGMYYILNEVDPIRCKEFFDKLVTGLNLNVNDPVYAIREKFIRASANPLLKVSVNDAVFYIAKAWCYFKEDKQAKQIRRSKKEGFPQI